MKATGIVRKVDELGRIVLPKDIRRSLGLKEGTPMEIFINGNMLVLKQYSQLQNFQNQAKLITECLAKTLDCDVVITDLSNCISCSGKNKKELENITVTSNLDKIINDRKTVIHNKISKQNILQTQLEILSILITPIVVNGDCYGSIICLSTNKEFVTSDAKCVNMMACLISNKCDL